MSAPAPWSFGLEPLPQAIEIAPLLRRVAGLVLALDDQDPTVARLIAELRAAEQDLAARVPAVAAPRIGPDASPALRPYIDHGRRIGAYNPCFPDYTISVDGARAAGTVTFPLAFEGPPGIVHGGVLATFFDCVVQHHNCDVGVAGRTTSLVLEYHRPTPLGVDLAFEIDREAGERRITSRARLARGAETVCTATIDAVAGDRNRLPQVAPRVPAP
jgi:acyl-coenzyme A thioesterase PaaI-like protein